MAEPAIVALLQAAMRRRLITRERAVAVAEAVSDCGDDTAELRRLLRASPEREAIMLLELLPADDLPPVKPWRRLARLGDGRTATAWLGIGDEKRLVVIKVFHANRISAGPEADRFKDECQELLGLGSRYLVGYHEARRSADHRAVVIQEYVPGRDLAARASTKGPMPEAKALPLLRQVAKGLHVLSHHGRCHGMLHPGNILVSSDGRARLNDYGFAVSTTRHGLRPGWDARSLMLHAFAAPEMLAGSAQPSIAADQYSLACIGYWLLSGQPPFAGAPDEQAAKHATAPRPDVRSVAPKVTAITAAALMRAMSIDPADRFGSPLELANQLHAALRAIVGAEAKKPERVVDVTPSAGTAVLAAPAPATSASARAETVGADEEPPSGARRGTRRRTRRRRR